MTDLAHRCVPVLLALAAVALVLSTVRVADRVRDRRAARRLIEGVVADAEAAYARYVRARANAALAESAEPWRSSPAVGADPSASGLVDSGAPNTLNGETHDCD